MNTIRAEWDTFEKTVMPLGASCVQIQEMRRAFYAGAYSQYKLCLCAANESETAAVGMMNGWHDELLAFAKSVGTDQEGK